MKTGRIWIVVLIATSLWLATRVVVGQLNAFDYIRSQPFGVAANLLFLLLSIAYVLYFTYAKEVQVRSYFDDFKLSMKTGIAYTVLMGFIFTGYYSLSQEMSIKRSNDSLLVETSLDTPEEVAAAQNSNEALKDLTKEQIQQSLIERVNTMTSVKIITTIGVAGTVLSTLVYALILPAIFRNLLLREVTLNQ